MFLVPLRIGGKVWLWYRGGYFTDIMLQSWYNYHQERATELRRLSKYVTVACGAVILRFHGVSFLLY